MDFESLKEKFLESKNDINVFFEKIKIDYLKNKTFELVKKGLDRDSAHNRARQSWRTFVGHSLQSLLIFLLKEFFKNTNVKVLKDSELKGKNLTKEKSLVRRMLEIPFDNYSFLPDADIIIYNYDEKNEKVKIFCIISVKNSFRERGFETTYWKLKLMENKITKNIKVFMITPDKDDEITVIKGLRGPKKTRIILEYELDKIYLVKENFEKTDKVKNIKTLFKDIKELVGQYEIQK